MNENHNEQAQESIAVESAVAPLESGLASARRRLLKRGISIAPVVLTLASRPVLAWHCKSPSAWGSEQLNPNTSLKANAGHKSWADETWSISNWMNNTAYNGFGKPWEKLYAKFPGIKSNAGNSFDFRKVTVGKLSATGIGIPGGLNTDATVVSVLSSGGEFQKYIIVAQLNFLLLAPLASPNDLDMCISSIELKKMASGSYTPPNLTVVWNSTDIKNYLYENWIVRP